MTATATKSKSKSSNSDKSTLGFIILAAAAAGGYFLWKKNSGNTEMIDLGGSGYALGGGSGLSDLSGYVSDETGGGIIPESVTVPNAASEAATVPYYDYETTDGIDGLDADGNYNLANLGATDKADMGIGDLFTTEELNDIKVSAAAASGLVALGLGSKGLTAAGDKILANNLGKAVAKSAPTLGDSLLTGAFDKKALGRALTTNGVNVANSLKSPLSSTIGKGLSVVGKIGSRAVPYVGTALLISDVVNFFVGKADGGTPDYWYDDGLTYDEIVKNRNNTTLFNVKGTDFKFNQTSGLYAGVLTDYSTGATPATATAKTDIKKDTMTTETNIRNVDKKNNSYTADISTGYTVGMANTSTSEMQDYFAKMNPETATAAQTQQAAVYGATVGSKYTKKAEQVNSSTGQTYSQMKSDYSSGKGVVTGSKNGVKTYQSTKVQTTPVKETYN